MGWLGIFKKDKERFKKRNNRIYYNQEETIIEHISKKDKAYLIDMRNFFENIIKESYSIDKESKENVLVFIDLIDDEKLKNSLHNIRKRANSVAHDLDSVYESKYVSDDLKCIDDLIDYLKNLNSNLNNYEFFSLASRMPKASLIADNKIYSSKEGYIDHKEVKELFVNFNYNNKEYYTSSYNAKEFCMVISFELYYSKTAAIFCPPIFYVVHNILIRKDMVRKSKFLSELSLTNAELDAIRIYEIIILHAMRYGAFYFGSTNEIAVPYKDLKYVKIAYENIMYYAKILNSMQKNKTDLNFKVEISSNGDEESSRIFFNKYEIKYEILESIADEIESNMWFTQKIDYEFKEENKFYFIEMLRDLFGHKDFRPGQLDVIKNILENNIKTIPLSIFPTGYGKSLIYQYCAILEPQKTIVICPTEVLACDQIFNLNEDGLNIGKIISFYEKNLNDRNGNLIYYTIPNIFLNYELNEKLTKEDAKDNIYNIVLDECHNISLWGHQFDPAYFSLSKTIINNFKNCNVTMFTATASELVINNIKNQFSDREIEIFQPVPLDRGNITYQIKKVNNINDIVKDLSNLFTSNYGKANNWDLNYETSGCLYKTLIINNDKEILEKLFLGLQENDYILPHIAQFNDSVGTYMAFRNGSKKVLLSNDDFVVGINIPELVNLVCVGVPPSKEWIYQESGRVGRNFEDSNVIIYIPNKPSELFNKMIDTSIDVKDILANKEIQSQLNIDVSNINYFNSYFQDKNRQLSEYDNVEKEIENNIIVINNNEIGKITFNLDKEYNDTFNYLLYMLCLIDYIKSWQTETSDDKKRIIYRLKVRDIIDIQDMANYLNEIIKVSTKNTLVRNKYFKKNNLAKTRKQLLENLLDWYYDTIISNKREMLINTYELLLNTNITSKEIEKNLAIYFDIGNIIRKIETINDESINVINNKDNPKLIQIIEEIESTIEEKENLYCEDIDNSNDDFAQRKKTLIKMGNERGYITFEELVEVETEEIEVEAKEVEEDIEEEGEEKKDILTKELIGEEKSDNTDNKTSKENYTESNKSIDNLLDIFSKIYDDKYIGTDFVEIYRGLNKIDKYNLEFILQREIESGYIYGYEMVIALVELEKKGSKLIRFKKFAKNTNKQLLELLVEELRDTIPRSNIRKAYKIIFNIYKPNTFREWFRKTF